MKDPAEVKVTLVQVRLVELRGPSAVVEYAGGTKRAIVPSEELIDGAVSTETLDMGLPYGLPWERMVQMAATPQALADELRRNGIWTLADLEANPRAVVGALQNVYGVDLGYLLRAAHEEVKHGK